MSELQGCRGAVTDDGESTDGQRDPVIRKRQLDLQRSVDPIQGYCRAVNLGDGDVTLAQSRREVTY
ncbi:MAG: hypothetical protein IPN16_09710 [Gemmatimonadetes bacterium]|nr:hypothetical protein [Gemmatimonadota bacterium]